MTKTIAEALAGNTYPGRGIIVGTTPGGTMALAYFIMGRSVNSRNRVLVEDDGAIFTRPVDLALVSDPSLIIYAALRTAGDATVLTNGDQTDTIVDAIADLQSFIAEYPEAPLPDEAAGEIISLVTECFDDALRTRTFEPDAPNFTSRISALVQPGSYALSQLRESHGTTLRAFWEYEWAPGLAHLIHTYAGDGNPLPAFTGEPVEIAVGDDQTAWTNDIWAALDADNRISLMTRFIPVSGAPITTIINRF